MFGPLGRMLNIQDDAKKRQKEHLEPLYRLCIYSKGVPLPNRCKRKMIIMGLMPTHHRSWKNMPQTLITFDKDCLSE